jgi:DNA polymerase III gamma/tau subunit
MGEVPESLPVTEETRERLRAQANQLGEATVLRLCDLLAVAVEDMRQGGDPRLPLELALVKVTRPGADLSAESISYRLEQLEQRGPAAHVAVSDTGPGPEEPRPEATPPPEPPSIELAQLREVWQRSVVPAVQSRAIHAAPVIGEATPAALEGDRLTLEFPPSADFHRKLAEEKYASLLRDALYEVTGRRLELEFALGENGEEPHEEPASEEDLVALVKETFDAREVDE